MKKTLIFLGIILSFIFSANQVLGYGCLEYGFAAQSNFNGTCSCMSGYHFETTPFGGKQCVKDPTCYEKYGFGSQDNYDGTCSCSKGYHFGKNDFGDTQCLKNPSCSDTYGLMAFENLNGTCSCRSGYVFGKDIFGKESCVNGNNYCTNKYGSYSSYSSTSKSCKCDEGYTLKDGECVEKHNSAYFYLSEYNDDDNTALVISYVTKEKYLLELRYTSGLYKAEQFIGKDIVINMGTDFNIDRHDKFILNNQTKTTDIVSDILNVEDVSDTYTLKTCEDIFGYNSEETYDNKCKCKDGYTWNYNKTSCEEIEDNTSDNSMNIDYSDNSSVETNSTNYRDTQMNKYYKLYKPTLGKKLASMSETKLNNLKTKVLKIVNTYESSNTLTKKKKDEKVALFLAIYLIIDDIIKEK